MTRPVALHFSLPGSGIADSFSIEHFPTPHLILLIDQVLRRPVETATLNGHTEILPKGQERTVLRRDGFSPETGQNYCNCYLQIKQQIMMKG